MGREKGGEGGRGEEDGEGGREAEGRTDCHKILKKSVEP